MKTLVPVLLTLTCGAALAGTPITDNHGNRITDDKGRTIVTDSDCEARYTLKKDGTVLMANGHPKLAGYYTYSTDKDGKPKWKACKPHRH
ncbi:MAG TPA: hypothetical protein VGV09_13395 [Steroidobacteraceae bacterium]|nr:hypothetical protein [Steroidobacteraceae bacterium]